MEKEVRNKLYAVGSKRGGDKLAEFRKQFHPGARKPDEEETEPYKPLFKLSIKGD